MKTPSLLIALIVAISLIAATTGCQIANNKILKGDGNVLEQTTYLKPFHSVEISGMFDILLLSLIHI